MAVTTMDLALAGMQYPREFFKSLSGTMVAGRPHSYYMIGGIPCIGLAPASGIGGEVLTTVQGQIPFTNPGAGNTYLSKFLAHCTIPGTLLLCDRLWQNSGIDVTNGSTEQTFTSSAQIPARDENGSNAGVGVLAGVEVITQTGAGTPTLTLKYTDQDGNAGITSTNLMATVATSIVGTFYPIGLAAGDSGIQKAQSIQLSATWTSGTISVVLYRVLARLDLTIAHTPASLDLFSSGFTRMYDNTVPFLILIPSTTTTSLLGGEVVWTQG